MDADMLRRWWRDHGEIDRAVDEVRLDLGRSESGAADQVARLAEALERHFTTEEQIYFPLAASTCVDSVRLLDRARWGHQQLREVLSDLRTLVANAEIDSAHRTFATLLRGLQTHEEEEVAILVELERLNATPVV